MAAWGACSDCAPTAVPYRSGGDNLAARPSYIRYRGLRTFPTHLLTQEMGNRSWVYTSLCVWFGLL